MPDPTVFCLSWSHHSARVDTRAAVSTAIQRWQERRSAQSGHVALLTCNRAELYVDRSYLELAPEAVLAELATLGDLSLPELQTTHRLWQGAEAGHHLLRVAAGLESMVLGEPQILGQVSAAWEQAMAQKTLSPQLDALFEAAVRAGKRVRNETAISRHPASMSSVAIHSLLRDTGSPQEVRALVIGYGDMSRLALKALRGHGVQQIGIANRRPERARDEADRYGYRLWDLQHLAAALAWADVVFCAASAPQPLVDAELLQLAVSARPQRPLVAVDIAVPPNIAPEAAQMAGFTLIGIDQLQRGVDKGLAPRRACVPAVEAILAQEQQRLQAALHELRIRPLLRDLRLKAERIRIQELQRTMRYLGDVDEETRQQLQHFSQALINKLLHEPTVHLRQKAHHGEAERYAETVRELFGLP